MHNRVQGDGSIVELNAFGIKLLLNETAKGNFVNAAMVPGIVCIPCCVCGCVAVCFCSGAFLPGFSVASDGFGYIFLSH